MTDTKKTEQLAELLKDATAEDRLDILKQFGLVVPEGGDMTARDFGYVCQSCGELALEFIGSKPPVLTQPASMVPWSQDAGQHQSLSRANPKCMSCNRHIPLQSGMFAKPGLWKSDAKPGGNMRASVVPIGEWRAAKNAALAEVEGITGRAQGIPAAAEGAMSQIQETVPMGRADRIRALHASAAEASALDGKPRDIVMIHKAVERANAEFGFEDRLRQGLRGGQR